jgi:hypothetical protein
VVDPTALEVTAVARRNGNPRLPSVEPFDRELLFLVDGEADVDGTAQVGDVAHRLGWSPDEPLPSRASRFACPG